jgi:hypothetical protein
MIDEQSQRLPDFFANDLPHWRRRAVETHLLARRMKDREAKALLLKLAASHDKLAELANVRIRLWNDHLSSRSMT